MPTLKISFEEMGLSRELLKGIHELGWEACSVLGLLFLMSFIFCIFSSNQVLFRKDLFLPPSKITWISLPERRTGLERLVRI